MLSYRLEDKRCLTGRQSGFYIVENREKERMRNPGWISQQVTDVEREGRSGKKW